MKDYKDKKVYLGIDVHKKTYSVAAICEGQTVKKATLPADPKGLILFCKKYFPGAEIKSVYEAGFSGFSLHRLLKKNDIDNMIVHAAGIEIATGNKVKTDKRDSVKLATQLSAGRLRSIYIPTEKQEERRAVTRIRETLVEHRATIAIQIKSFLHHHGVILENVGNRVCAKWINNLKNLHLSQEIKFALEQLIDLWQGLTIQIKSVDNKLIQQATEDKELEDVYRSAPGIGPVCARVFSNELGDLSQFANERQLFSYTGMTPSEHSSGGHIRKGHISHQGKPIIRKLLVLAAWKAIQKDPSLREAFDRIMRKAGSKRAIIAIGRKLIGRIRACFNKRCYYKNQELKIISA